MSRGRSSSAGRLAGAVTRRARPTSCASSSWSSALRRALRGLDGLERARDVGAEGVVLRLVDRAARREQDDERDGDERARCRSPCRSCSAASASRRRGPRTRRARRASRRTGTRAGSGCAGRSRSRRGPPCGRSATSSCAALRDALDDVAVDGPQVDAQAGGEPDRLEARAPVDERHVDVERALVAGGDATAGSSPTRELAVLAEGRRARGSRRPASRPRSRRALRPAAASGTREEVFERVRRRPEGELLPRDLVGREGVDLERLVGGLRARRACVAAKTISTTRSSARE